MVSFEWYRSFIAVYRSGTVTGAAEARSLTQPAISQHIVALETMLKQPLFKRMPRKMVPTDYGKALYSRLAPSMDSLEKTSTNFQASNIETFPTVRLGTPLDYLYKTGIEKLKDSQLRLHIETGDTDAMIEQLLLGKLDAVIATQRIPGTHLDYSKIDEESFCVVASPHIRMPKKLTRKYIQLTDIENFMLQQNWISYSPELPIIRRFWHIAFNQRPDIKPIMIIPSLLAIRKAVESDCGISILPYYICEDSLNQDKLKVLWQPEKKISNELWLVSRKVDRNMPYMSHLYSCFN